MSGAVVWMTGLPSSGKSTFAQRLFARLHEAGRPAALLDGDAVREALVPKPGYGAADRDAFYATLAHLAALLARQDLVVLVAATAHRRAWRDAARSLSPQFVEVYMDVSQSECRRRDAKGLYARAAEGKAQDLPGADVLYEPPRAPEVLARGGEDTFAVEEVLQRLRH